MSVLDLLHSLDGWEWNGWLDYASIEPFGPLREDMRAGRIAATMCGGKAKPSDFFASLKESRPRGRDKLKSLIRLCPALTPISG